MSSTRPTLPPFNVGGNRSWAKDIDEPVLLGKVAEK